MKTITDIIRRKNKRNQKGAVIVLFALLLPVLVGMAGLAIDLGLAYLITNELQNAADLGALTGIRRFTEVLYDPDYSTSGSKMTEVISTVQQTTAQNFLRFSGGVQIDATDIETGIWNRPDIGAHYFQQQSISSSLGSINAVKVTVRQSSGGNQPFSWRLARVLGLTTDVIFTRDAVAMGGVRRTVFALDISGSMEERTYPYYPLARTPACNPSIPITTKLRTFKVNPRPSWSSTYCLGGMPQPITEVFETTRDFINDDDILLFSRFYGIGVLVYETDAVQRIPSDGTPVKANDNKTEVVNELQSIIDHWDSYKDNGKWIFDANNVYPGGNADPNVVPISTYDTSKGWTNVGRALTVAGNMLAMSQASEKAHINEIILLSDGLANCYPSGDCKDDTAHIDAARTYALQQADNAFNQEIRIHSIFFGAGCFDATPPDGYVLLRDISERTGGRHYCAADITGLGIAFNDLNEEMLFVLVE